MRINQHSQQQQIMLHNITHGRSTQTVHLTATASATTPEDGVHIVKYQAEENLATHHGHQVWTTVWIPAVKD